MMGYGAGLGFGVGGLLTMLGGILLVIGLVVLIVWAVGRVGQPAAGGQPVSQDAAEVLRLRFARGEMTADEYKAARDTLEAHR
jgi:putative membrane protein